MKYRIGEFSALSKVSERTLRYYDRIGLLKPSEVDVWNKYRYYSTEQLDSIQTIIRYRRIGFSIEEIRKILQGCSTDELLEKKKTQLLRERSEIDASIKMLEEMIMVKNDYSAVVKDIPSCIIYSRSGTIPTYADLPGFVMETAQLCMEANPGIECPEPGYCFVTYDDKGYVEKNVRLTYYEAVKTKGKDTDEIKFRELRSVTALCVMHRGSYSDLGKAYAFVMDYAEKNGYVPCDAPREQYIDGCWNKESEDDYLTEIQVPIRKL